MSVFDVAPEEDLLYSLSADGQRRFFHPVVRPGRFLRMRRLIAYGLFVAFVALPLITIGGYPSLQFDLASRQTHVFGETFYPTDSLILVSFGFGIIVTVFFVGSTFGRMWCGYACPQTVWLEFMFRPIEAWLEGSPANRRRLDQAPWTAEKFAIKFSKWGIWSLLALVMAANFVAYFVGWRPWMHGLATDPSAWMAPVFVALFVAGMIVFDFGWFRDQMCTIACPYGRLQNVLADQDTILVAYDEKRGDPKVKLKDRKLAVRAGDCIDCRACVNACPTGTDIRRGLQSECIGTAQCVDACDEVMLGQQKPIGLIKYTSERQQKGGEARLLRFRNIAYVVLMTIAWSSFTFLIVTRSAALVEVLRGGREPYRMLPTGDVANQQRVRITNQLTQPQAFTIEILSPKEAVLVVSESPIVAGPEKLVTANAVVTVPRRVFEDGQATVRYLVKSDKGYSKQIEFLLLGPYGSGDGSHEKDKETEKGEEHK